MNPKGKTSAQLYEHLDLMELENRCFLDKENRMELARLETQFKLAKLKAKANGKPSAPQAVGERIDALRNECGWSFDKLAAKTGFDKKLVLGHIKKGKGATLRTLKMYADAFSKELKRIISVADIKG